MSDVVLRTDVVCAMSVFYVIYLGGLGKTAIINQTLLGEKR